MMFDSQELDGIHECHIPKVFQQLYQSREVRMIMRLTDISLAKKGALVFKNFLIPTESAVFRFSVPSDCAEVVVTFEPAGAGKIDRSDPLRLGFGEKFLLENGFAVVSVLPNSANWYRPDDIIDFLASSELRYFLGNFDRVHTYGFSMGAFGACAFADLLGAGNVIALSLISTLRPDLVPWEKRFKPGAHLNWNGRYADACEGVNDVQSIYLIYDQECPDKLHADRMAMKHRETLRCVLVPGVKHATAGKLSAAGLLKPLVLACLKGQQVE